MAATIPARPRSPPAATLLAAPVGEAEGAELGALCPAEEAPVETGAEVERDPDEAPDEVAVDDPEETPDEVADDETAEEEPETACEEVRERGMDELVPERVEEGMVELVRGRDEADGDAEEERTAPAVYKSADS